MPKEKIKYCCDVCGSEHSSYIDARKCEDLPTIKLPLGSNYQIGDKLELPGRRDSYLITEFKIYRQSHMISSLMFEVHFAIPMLNRIIGKDMLNIPEPMQHYPGGELARIVERKEKEEG